MNRKKAGRLFSVNRAFTLIELLVVILIIGILLALVVPNFVLMQERVRRIRLGTKIKNPTRRRAGAEMVYQRDSRLSHIARGRGCGHGLQSRRVCREFRQKSGVTECVLMPWQIALRRSVRVWFRFCHVAISKGCPFTVQ